MLLKGLHSIDGINAYAIEERSHSAGLANAVQRIEMFAC